MQGDVDAVRRVATGIRRRVAELARVHSGAYLAQACSSAEILGTLYVRLMELGPSTGEPEPSPLDALPRPGLPGRWGGEHNGTRASEQDRFMLSPAHYAAALYAALVEVGRLSERALETYALPGTALEMVGSEHAPGFEATTGSLGQGLSVAIGMALARRITGRRGTMWVLLSDGELQEGQTWEALMAAAHHRLGTVAVYLDANGQQVDGPPDTVMTVDPIAAKVAAFGWLVREVDGHDVEALTAAARSRPRDQPLFVICRTRPWQGLPSLRARYPRKLHFVRFQPGESESVLADLATADV